MRKYKITLMDEDDTIVHAYAECGMSIIAQKMAYGWLYNSKNARWVKVEDDNGKMIVIYFQNTSGYGKKR